MKKKKSHKLIHLIALWGLLCGSLGLNIPEGAATTSSKQVLTQADFTYIGAFAMPATVPSGGDPSFGKGLTHRYVNGELHMFSSTWDPVDIYEVKVPNLSLNAPFPTASVVRNWGATWSQKAITDSGNPVRLWGLYWDEADKRLYVSHGSDYNSVAPDDPSILYLSLSDTTGASTPVGPWNFSNREVEKTMGCVVPLPQWFANAYTGGKRLSAGCGGCFSGALSFLSYGPALTAFSPPNQAEQTSLANTILVGYPQPNSGNPAYNSADVRVHRDPDYSGGNWGGVWNPQNGVGYWTSGDLMWQSAVWIDLPDKHAVIYFPYLGNGNIWYQVPGMFLETERASHAWFVYDPADLAAVAQGQKQQNEIQPVEWLWQYPGISYPLPGWGPEPGNVITGATYDSTTRRLYVAVRWGAVYVYEVQGSSDNAPPAAPRGLRVR
jgi:hypothetical protein